MSISRKSIRKEKKIDFLKKKKTQEENPEVDVLYQKLGDDWYAFSMRDENGEIDIYKMDPESVGKKAKKANPSS